MYRYTVSTRQWWENWKGTRGFWIISLMFFQGNWPIVISCLLQSFRRDLKNVIKGCRSQMKTFLIEYPDLMMNWTTISTLDWLNVSISSVLGILGETSEVYPILKHNEELCPPWNIHPFFFSGLFQRNILSTNVFGCLGFLSSSYRFWGF